MKLWQTILLAALIAILGWGMYDLRQERKSAQDSVSELQAQVDKLNTENTELKSDIEYFKNPDNLVKELKSEFNYRAPDEKMLIIVPNNTTGTSATSGPIE